LKVACSDIGICSLKHGTVRKFDFYSYRQRKKKGFR
jgi:hypothetical protein